MNIKAGVPTLLKRAIRGSYVGWGSVTAKRRVQPTALIIGAQRCGTTSLFRALEQHAHVVRPTFNKGINYFDVNYHRGPRWYAGHFPLRTTVDRMVPKPDERAVFEASGYYIFHPLAPHRIAKDLPDVRIVAMLRNPMDRAYSAWKHEKARGFENKPFYEALLLESSRVDEEAGRMMGEPSFEGFSHRHHAYCARGDYLTQLQQYYDLFPSNQIHVVYSEHFFSQPEDEFGLLEDFLGIPHQSALVFDRHNARGSGPMPEDAERFLRERFSGQAERLTQLVGRRPPWGALG